MAGPPEEHDHRANVFFEAMGKMSNEKSKKKEKEGATGKRRQQRGAYTGANHAALHMKTDHDKLLHRTKWGGGVHKKRIEI